MRWKEIIAESSDPDFSSLDEIRAWARTIGVNLDAQEHVATGGPYGGSISVIWIERGKKAAKGTGRRVMDALCRYADSARATIDLQADDEVVLPDYYATFGFKIVKSDSGDDVTPTGPDMRRMPRTRKARRPLGSARPFDATQSQPIGVALMYIYGGDNPYYYTLFPANKIANAESRAVNAINDAEDIWVGYIINTIEWTELLPKAGIGSIEVIPPIIPNPTTDAQIRSNKRWTDLRRIGKKVFEVKL